MIRRARPADAPLIAAVHVAAWRSAYAGLLPAHTLTRMSVHHHAAQYDADIRADRGIYVAVADGRIAGFTTAGHPRTPGLADGEIETLYVLDDFRDRGLGRRLLQSGAAHLAANGCASLFLWVLRDNPARWFYERLGGRPTMDGTAIVGGQHIPQRAYVWTRNSSFGDLTPVLVNCVSGID